MVRHPSLVEMCVYKEEDKKGKRTRDKMHDECTRRERGERLGQSGVLGIMYDSRKKNPQWPNCKHSRAKWVPCR